MKKAYFLLFVVASVLFVTLNANSLSLRLQMPEKLAWEGLAVAIAFQLAFWWLLSRVWVVLLRKVAATQVGMWLAFNQQSLVSLGKYFPGKVWGMIARGGQMRVSGMGVASIAKVTYLEQLFLLHSGLALSGALAIAVIEDGSIRFLGSAALLSVPIAACLHERVLGAFVAIVRKVLGTTEQEEVAHITATDYLRFVAGYGLVWLLSGFVLVGLYIAFIDQNLTVKLLAVLLLANAVGIWMGFVAVFAPGGIGVREATSIVVMLPFVQLEAAVTLTVLSRVWLLLMDALSGFIALWSLRDERHR